MVPTLFDEKIDNYIHLVETEKWTLLGRLETEEIKFLNATEAAEFIFSDIERAPRNFNNTFSQMARLAGYESVNMMTKGIRKRRWIKDEPCPF